MISPMSKDSLDVDPETLVFEMRRGTVRVHGLDVPSLFGQCGVDRCQWDHLQKCWLAPVRFLPALLERAEKDQRDVIIEQVDE
jgi:hypothetical protein